LIHTNINTQLTVFFFSFFFRKQNRYHHVTVLLFTWFTYSNENPGIIFIAMNYSVHAVMYSYYWLAIVKKVPDWFPTWLITLAQIAQMVRPSLPLSLPPSFPPSLPPSHHFLPPFLEKQNSVYAITTTVLSSADLL